MTTAGYAQFAAIYLTSIARPQIQQAVVDPIKLEFFQGPKTLSIPAQTSSVVPKGSSATFAGTRNIALPPGDYVSLTARTKIARPLEARLFCEQRLDQAIANLSLILDPSLFADCIYRGWISSKDQLVFDAWVKMAEPIDIGPGLEEQWRDASLTQDRDESSARRFRLMAKFLTKALTTHPGDERFLYLWTILEIWPMQDTSDIGPISHVLAAHMARDASQIKEELQIGRLFGARSQLIHNGLLPIPLAQLGQIIARLEAVCIEIIRAMVGLPYSGKLNQYLRK